MGMRSAAADEHSGRRDPRRVEDASGSSSSDRFGTPEIKEVWLSLEEEQKEGARWRYRPALLIECVLEFRDPRAEVVHSEDRSYTAWVPPEGAAVDWSVPAVSEITPDRVRSNPQPEILPYEGEVRLTDERWDEFEQDLRAHLVRTEHLSLYYNPNLHLYSKRNESREEFLERAKEEMRARLQPRLKELMREFQLHLEQLRQRPLPQDVPEELSTGWDVHRRRLISRIEAQLNRMVLDHPMGSPQELSKHEGGSSMNASSRPARSEGASWSSAEDEAWESELGSLEELRPVAQELEHLYDAARARVRALLEEAWEQVRDCEPYRIGLHPNAIRILRRAVLWVPTRE